MGQTSERNCWFLWMLQSPMLIALSSRPALLRTPVRKVCFLALAGAALFTLPYLVKVPPVVSLSYEVGFSNRTALVIYVVGIALFAILARGEFARMEQTDQRLGYRLLAVALALTLIGCVAQIHSEWRHGWADGEAFYGLNRQQMVAAGLTPYRQFEFVYGPILVYSGYWIARLLHVSQPMGYYISWTAQWLVGMAMICWVVRSIDFPVRFRRWLFVFFVAESLPAIRAFGPSYTPFRGWCAAAGVVLVFGVWRRTRNPWWAAAATVAAVGVGLCCSIEQGLGIASGLLGYFALAAWVRPATGEERFSKAALGVAALGVAGCFGLAVYAGMMISTRSFSAGGMAFPLLASPTVCLILMVYFVAGCVVYRQLAARELNSVAVPLSLAGFAMLPSCLGRCDYGHLMAATPAVIVALAAISAMPSIRIWWFSGMVLVSYSSIGVRIISSAAYHLKTHTAIGTVQPVAPESLTDSAYERMAKLSPRIELAAAEMPCDRKYYAPFLTPSVLHPYRPACVDSGYYMSLVDVLTSEGIARKLDEFRQRPNEPLLLRNAPMDKQIVTYEDEIDSLRTLEESFYVPKLRNAPVSLAVVGDYIRAHYRPGPVVTDGHYQVWYPVDSR